MGKAYSVHDGVDIFSPAEDTTDTTSVLDIKVAQDKEKVLNPQFLILNLLLVICIP